MDEAILHISALHRTHVKQVRSQGEWYCIWLHLASPICTQQAALVPLSENIYLHPYPILSQPHYNCFLANHVNKAKFQQSEQKVDVLQVEILSVAALHSKLLITSFTICLTLFYWSDAFWDTDDTRMLMHSFFFSYFDTRLLSTSILSDYSDFYFYKAYLNLLSKYIDI